MPARGATRQVSPSRSTLTQVYPPSSGHLMSTRRESSVSAGSPIRWKLSGSLTQASLW